MSSAFSMIADYEGDINNLFSETVNGNLPILATRNLMMFPGVVSPIFIGRKSSMKLVEAISKKKRETIIAVFCQKDTETEEPSINDLYEYGVYAKIVRTLELPGQNNTTIILQGMGRCHLDSIKKKTPYIIGNVSEALETIPSDKDK